MHVGINSLFLVPKGMAGMDTYLRNVIRTLPALDPSVRYTLFTNRENAGTFDFDGHDAAFHEVPTPVTAVHPPVRLAWEYTALPVQAARAGVDVLFCPGFTAPARSWYRSVVNIHDMRHEDLPEDYDPVYRFILTRIMRRVAHTAAQILTVSEHAKRRIVAVYGVSPERVTVSPNAAEPMYFVPVSPSEIARVRAKYGLPGRYILSVGTLLPHKNLDALIDAYLALRRMDDAGMSSVRLVLTGLHGAATAKLEAKMRAAGGAGGIVLTGWVPDADLPALYAGATVYVSPSRYEGFGIPVLEAMASGAPVITTTATALPEVAGDAALLVHPNDHAALTVALRRVLADANLRASLIARGHIRARQFTWERTAAATLAAFEAACHVALPVVTEFSIRELPP